MRCPPNIAQLLETNNLIRLTARPTCWPRPASAAHDCRNTATLTTSRGGFRGRRLGVGYDVVNGNLT
jgi:hypothetical protein